MRPVTLHEIIPLQRPIQHFADCYMIASISALARSKDGQKVLSRNVAHRGDEFRIKFQKINDCAENYFVTPKEMQKLAQHTFFNSKKADRKFKQNPIILAIESAMNKLLTAHPEKKPLISRLMVCDEKFEYNKPSNFLEIFTGKKPIILNENGIRMNLTKDRDKAMELFEKIDDANDFAFVAGTGLVSRKGLAKIHCYAVEGVNTENQYIQVYNARNQASIQMSFEEAIRAFKFLTGFLR